MSTNKTVFVGFNPELGGAVMMHGIRTLVRSLSSAGLRVLVPKSYKLRTKERAWHIESVDELKKTRPGVCVFITPPVGIEDADLAKFIDRARELAITRHGFVFKASSDRLVPLVTFDMFRSRDTEVCNAVHIGEVESVIRTWVDSHLGL